MANLIRSEAGSLEIQQSANECNFTVKTETKPVSSTSHYTPKNLYEELYFEELRQQSEVFYHRERKLWLEEQKLKQELTNAENIADLENLQLRLDLIRQEMTNLDFEFHLTNDHALLS